MRDLAGRLLLLAVLALGTGCPGWRPPWPEPAPRPGPSGAADLVTSADAEAAAGRARTALELYDRVLRDFPGDPAVPRALHGLGLLRVDPQSPLRDLRLAGTVFQRLQHEYPGTPWAAEARGWRSLLRELERCDRQVNQCQAEATRLGADAKQLRDTLDALRETDLELEQQP